MIAFTTPYITKRAIVCFHPAFIIVDWAYPTCRITLDKDGLKAASFHPRRWQNPCLVVRKTRVLVHTFEEKHTRKKCARAKRAGFFSFFSPPRYLLYPPARFILLHLLLSLSLILLNSFVSPPPRCHNKPLVYSESSLSTILTFCSLSSVSTILNRSFSLSPSLRFTIPFMHERLYSLRFILDLLVDDRVKLCLKFSSFPSMMDGSFEELKERVFDYAWVWMSFFLNFIRNFALWLSFNLKLVKTKRFDL